jgi:predicted flap endonuclease-1-like 5' DNA nuclease
MRSDYALYALGIVFFLAAAVSAVMVTGQTEKTLWTASMVVIGFLFVSAGYVMKPKAKAAAVPPPETPLCQEPTPEPVPPAAATVETPTEAAKVESPVPEVAKAEAPPMIEAPKAEKPMLEKPAAAEALPPAPIPAPAAEAQAVDAAATPAQKLELTQIRGINEKRAEQLMANGISSVRDLAGASASDLAAKLNVSEKTVKMWIGSARKLAKQEP